MGADSKEGVVGDISICGFDIDFVLCLRLYRLKRRGGGRYKCEPLSQAIRTPRAAKSHRPLPHHHADRGSSSTIHIISNIISILESTSSCRSRLVINHRGIHIISKIIDIVESTSSTFVESQHQAFKDEVFRTQCFM